MRSCSVVLLIIFADGYLQIHSHSVVCIDTDNLRRMFAITCLSGSASFNWSWAEVSTLCLDPMTSSCVRTNRALISEGL
jgi:hypothetical protein